MTRLVRTHRLLRTALAVTLALALLPPAEARAQAIAAASKAILSEPPVIQALDWREFGLVLKSTKPINPELLVLSNPNRFVVDLPGAEFADPGLYRTLPVARDGVRQIRMAKQATGGVRLVFDCDDVPAFQVMQLGDKSTLVIARQGQRHAALRAMIMDAAGKPLDGLDQGLSGVWAREGDDRVMVGIAGSGGKPLRYSLFQEGTDRMRIRVPGGHFKGTVPQPGRLLKRAEVKTAADGFTLDVSLADGHYEVEESRSPDGGLTLTWERIVLNRPAGRPLVVIDPGHGGNDPGAIGPGGRLEKDVCLALARTLRDQLHRRNIDAILTRGADAEVYLAPRLALVERWKADLFVSLHANSHTTPDAAGIETFWREPASQPFAEVVHRTVATLLRRPDRGTKQERLYVLRHTRVPSLLLETGFISNPGEEKLLDDPDFQARAAFAIASGIESYLITPPRTGVARLP